jgi:hypothetical protein
MNEESESEETPQLEPEFPYEVVPFDPSWTFQ